MKCVHAVLMCVRNMRLCMQRTSAKRIKPALNIWIISAIAGTMFQNPLTDGSWPMQMRISMRVLVNVRPNTSARMT
eukprot:19535-Eustigmatos_ZCMA.PRE.1